MSELVNKINSIGTEYYGYVCMFAKWVFIIRTASKIIKTSDEVDISNIIKCMINGSIGYGSLYLIINVFETIESTFKE